MPLKPFVSSELDETSDSRGALHHSVQMHREKSKASGHPDPKSIGRDLSYGAFWRRAEHSRGIVRAACGTDSAQTKFKVLRMRPGIRGESRLLLDGSHDQ